MKKPLTDLKILKTIYNMYYNDFINYDKKRNKTRSCKMYVPIDIGIISKKLKVDPDIIFGRLYYHLKNKFGYKNDNGSKVQFFALKVGSDKHCVQFPYLASVLAKIESENRKFLIATVVSIVALILSLIAIFIR